MTFFRFVVLRAWPALVAAELVIAYRFGAPLDDHVMERLHDTLAVIAAIALVTSAVAPSLHAPRSIGVALTVGLFFDRAVWVVGWSPFSFGTRLVATGAYALVALAAAIIGTFSAILALRLP